MEKKKRFFDDEASHSGNSSFDEHYDSDYDSPGSLNSFIVPDGDSEDDSSDDKMSIASKRLKLAHSQNENPLVPLKTEDISTPEPKRGPGRPKKPETEKVSHLEKLPGDFAFPLNDFSLTVTKTGGDVSLSSLDIIEEFITTYCVKGGVATEVGSRAFNFHLQGIFRIHYPKTKDYVGKLQKFIKAMLPFKGKQHKVHLKVLSGQQNFTAMIGYITKDHGKEHYQLRTHGLTAVELSNGRREHDALVTSYDDSKKIISMKNLFNECYRFNMRCMYPAVVPIHYALLYMIQSANYVLTPEFVSNYRKINLDEAQILWKMFHDPRSTSIQMVLNLLFDPRSSTKKSNRRYFLRGIQALPPDTPISKPTIVNDGLNRADAIIKLCRSSNVCTQDSEDDVIQFTSDDDYVHLDDSPNIGNYSIDQYRYECPDSIDDMMVIVKQLRDKRLETLRAYSIESPPIRTNSSEITPVKVPKNRTNNYSLTINDFCR